MTAILSHTRGISAGHIKNLWRTLWVFVLLAPAVSAQVPDFIPVEGYLTDLNDNPVQAQVDLTVSIYTAMTGGDPIHTESRSILVQNGLFSFPLGAGGSVGPSLFRDQGELYLGVAVGQEGEMVPRFPVGVVPWAGYAAYANDAQTIEGLAATDLLRTSDSLSWNDLDNLPAGLADGDGDILSDLAGTCQEGQIAKRVGTGSEAQWQCAPDEVGVGIPSGMIVHFDLASCPPGWSVYDRALGRAIVGLPAGGTPGTQMGTYLSNLEDRAHNHTADPAAITLDNYPHRHSVNPDQAQTSSDGGHLHQWASFSGRNWYTYNSWGDSVNVVSWTNGIGNDGSGVYPVAHRYEDGDPPLDLYTDWHPGHRHEMDIDTTLSDYVTESSHTLDIANQTLSSATTGDIMPYLQLRVCIKD